MASAEKLTEAIEAVFREAYGDDAEPKVLVGPHWVRVRFREIDAIEKTDTSKLTIKAAKEMAASMINEAS